MQKIIKMSSRLKEMLDNEHSIMVYFEKPYHRDQVHKFLNTVQKNLDLVSPDYNYFNLDDKKFVDHVINNKKTYIEWLSIFDFESNVSNIEYDTLHEKGLQLIKTINGNSFNLSFKKLSTGTKQFLVFIYYFLLYYDKENIILVVNLYAHPIIAKAIYKNLLLKVKMKSIFIVRNKGTLNLIMSENELIQDNEFYEKKLLNICMI